MASSFQPSRIFEEVLRSTSDRARELVLKGKISFPFVVWCRRQTQGRGRGTNTWWSDEGSLTFTLALDPQAHELRTDHEPKLALAVAVAIIEALQPLLADHSPGIRWPNDVEVGGRKLCGILPERLDTPAGSRLLIGVGLNVRNNFRIAPMAVQQMATSLARLGVSAQIEATLDTILERIGAVLGALACDDPTLAATWAQLDLLLGRLVRIDTGPQILSGLGHGIDASGALRLEGPEGPILIYGGRVLREAAFVADTPSLLRPA